MNTSPSTISSTSVSSSNSIYSQLPPNLLAKKLNNRGCQLLSMGQYERAITALARALKISEHLAASMNNSNESNGNESSCLSCCTLDDCISASSSPSSSRCHSTQQDQQEEDQDDDGDCFMSQQSSRSVALNKNNSLSPSMDSCDSDCDSSSSSTSSSSSSSSFCGYLYTRPIYVPEIHPNHSMGITLSLIIIFNLALAHQLFVLTSQPSNSIQLFEKARQLYELAARLQHSSSSSSSSSSNDTSTTNDTPVNMTASIRFSLVVANNLGEIHRIMQNSKLHYMCMEHVLSTVMYLIDSNFPSTYIEIDGFLQNTSHLILQKQTCCAHAA